MLSRLFLMREYAAKLAALDKSQAVIEFNMDGTIITANPNFLGAMGYTLAEVQGKHHSMFVEESYKNSREYQQFWASLRQGEFQTSEYKRLGKGEREIWIQASYNPIMGMKGKPYKVVKFATDVTKQVRERMRNENVQHVIEANLETMDQAITNAARQSASASAAAAQTSSNVQAVASGAEQLNTSVQEISESMSRSREAVDSVAERTARANHATQRLTTAAQAMGGVVDLIKSIAGQINLLALNATIEAARAGEAGKGFAVVASEVKNLANQSAKATEDISREIVGIQEISSEVAKSLEIIHQSVDSVREYVTTTAGAVEEQSAVAREMSGNMQTAANAVMDVTNSVTEIALATEKADHSTKQVRDAARSLAG